MWRPDRGDSPMSAQQTRRSARNGREKTEPIQIGAPSGSTQSDSSGDGSETQSILIMDVHTKAGSGGFYYEPQRSEVGLFGSRSIGPFSFGIGIGFEGIGSGSHGINIWGFASVELEGQTTTTELAGLVGLDSRSGMYKGNIKAVGPHFPGGLSVLGGTETTSPLHPIDALFSGLSSVGAVDGVKSVIGPIANPATVVDRLSDQP